MMGCVFLSFFLVRNTAEQNMTTTDPKLYYMLISNGYTLNYMYIFNETAKMIFFIQFIFASHLGTTSTSNEE